MSIYFPQNFCKNREKTLHFRIIPGKTAVLLSNALFSFQILPELQELLGAPIPRKRFAPARAENSLLGIVFLLKMGYTLIMIRINGNLNGGRINV